MRRYRVVCPNGYVINNDDQIEQVREAVDLARRTDADPEHKHSHRVQMCDWVTLP